MSRTKAIAGSVVFFVLVPGVVAGWVPWWLTGWHVRKLPSSLVPMRVLGVALTAAGVAALVHTFVRFVAEGAGTPAPVAPTRNLVVGGLYRYVRNPMYLAVVGIILGQALALPELSLVSYAGADFVAVASFVHWYEEPYLSRQFGRDYDAYRRAVPAWWPRRRPSHPDGGHRRQEPARRYVVSTAVRRHRRSRVSSVEHLERRGFRTWRSSLRRVGPSSHSPSSLTLEVGE